MNLLWRHQAACRGLDPEIFYPQSDEESEIAKTVCFGCAVREACLEHAVGIPGTRRRVGWMHRERAPPHRPTAPPHRVACASHRGGGELN